MAPQREWFEKDFYKILGVKADDSAKEITRAYRKLARQLHPDANPDNPAAEDRFKEVSAAYDVLGDDERRREYDEVRRLGPAAGGFGPGGGGFRFESDDLGDLGGLFGNLFNQGSPSGGRGRRGPRRGADLEAELTLSFADAVHGVTTTVHLTSDATCSSCAGSGARAGTRPISCPQCGGAGVLNDNQGLFSFSRPCTRCNGVGHIVEDPCPTCGGRGIERRPRDVKVRIPAGVAGGQKIRLPGKGAPGAGGGPAGDLIVRVNVGVHPLFGRRADDLLLTVPVSFSEAALGGDIAVPTFDSEPVTLRIPAGTRSGRTFRVRGRGIASKKHTGDLLVTVEVEVPAELTDQQRQAIEALAAATDRSPRAHLGV